MTPMFLSCKLVKLIEIRRLTPVRFAMGSESSKSDDESLAKARVLEEVPLPEDLQGKEKDKTPNVEASATPDGSKSGTSPKPNKELDKVRLAIILDYTISSQFVDDSVKNMVQDSKGTLDRPLWRQNQAMLHWAASLGFCNLVQALLDLGVNKDCLRDDGGTKKVKNPASIHCAVFSGQHEVVKLLVRSRVDLSIVGKIGELEGTPMELASKLGHEAILATLKENRPVVGAEAVSLEALGAIGHKNESLTQAKDITAKLARVRGQENTLLGDMSKLATQLLELEKEKAALTSRPEYRTKEEMMEMTKELAALKDFLSKLQEMAI